MRWLVVLAILLLAQCGRPERASVSRSSYGPVCGSGDIRGVRLPAIRTRVPGCGIANPVEVSEVQGIRLEPATTLDCSTAKALSTWVRKTAKPDLRRTGGGLEALRVLDGYSCRPRNNVPGARLSVHSKGLAIDIGAFRLKNGATLSVQDGWRDRRDGRILRALHRGACGPFHTVLGPDYNGAHRNHFHFDLERNGNFCI